MKKVVTPEQFRTYQAEARKTDIYPEDERRLCLALGLVSEVGEVAGILKKLYRDGGPFPAEKLKTELGDCLWYVARLMDEYNIKYYKPDADKPEKTDQEQTLCCGINLAYVSADIAKKTEIFLPASLTVCERLRMELTFISFLEAYSAILSLCHFDMIEIMDKNIEKLLQRQKNGTLKGSGDNR